MLNSLMSLFSKGISVGSKNRYVSKFIPVSQELTPGKSELESDEERELYQTLVNSVEGVKAFIVKYPQIKEIDELLYFDVIDIPNLKFSMRIKDGDAEVKVGWDINIQPDFLLPLYKYNIINLGKITGDSAVDLKDAYRIIRVLLVPFMRGLYQADYSHLPEDKSYLKLDDFIQVEVTNDNNIEVDGFPGPARATAVNVDHQWLIFNKWQGDPDIRYQMNVEQAIKFAYMIRVKLVKGRPNLNELHSIIKKYNELKKETIVYEREWH